MGNGKPTNEQVAGVLEQIAELLSVQDANRFRISAYRDAADTVQHVDRSIAEMVLEGDQEALQELPNIGEGIARVIASYVKSGRSEMLERLQGEVAPGELFTRVPGIGKELAERIARTLDVSTLPELEQAAHDGRLDQVEGFGDERVRNVQVSLAGMLSTAAQRRRREGGEEEDPDRPRVETLLEVDEEYRRKAEAGELHKIAPKRFNPEGKAWLPILHTEREGWEFTALYSNTKRAHELDKTDDWVVLYFEQDGEENQATVVTETHGSLDGKRVVRGREAETRRYYREQGG
jgi:Holliday junction resolvasome RuvABC DNA-binding subunit